MVHWMYETYRGVIERNALSNVCNYEKMCSVWNGGRFSLSLLSEREREERERECTQNVSAKKITRVHMLIRNLEMLWWFLLFKINCNKQMYMTDIYVILFLWRRERERERALSFIFFCYIGCRKNSKWIFWWWSVTSPSEHCNTPFNK